MVTTTALSSVVGFVFFSHDLFVDLPVANATLPHSGPMTGNTTLQVFGGPFVNSTVATVTFSGLGMTPVSVPATYVSVSQVQCVTPAFAVSGNMSVTVALNGQQQSNTTALFFVYRAWLVVALCVWLVAHVRAAAFTLSRALPFSGPLSGSTRVTVVGSGFSSTDQVLVSFATDTVAGTFATASTIVCDSPAHASAGSVALQVALNGQQFASPSVSFLYYADPTLAASPYPASGPTTGGTVVAVYGTGFINTTEITVKFGSAAPVAATFASTGLVIAVAPAVATGTVNVSVSLNSQQYAGASSYLFYGIVFLVLALMQVVVLRCALFLFFFFFCSRCAHAVFGVAIFGSHQRQHAGADQWLALHGD
jgi:hypothetical protein